MSYQPAASQFRAQGHQARAPRRKVSIPVRMRVGNGWSDVRLLDISIRGLQVKCAVVPARGAYVEVRRGQHVIIARVIWAKVDRFGAQTQDPVAVDALTSQQDNSPPAEAGVSPGSTERRAVDRSIASTESHERSRFFGRGVEFGFVAAGVLALVLWCASLVQGALATPLSVVAAALN